MGILFGHCSCRKSNRRSKLLLFLLLVFFLSIPDAIFYSVVQCVLNILHNNFNLSVNVLKTIRGSSS